MLNADVLRVVHEFLPTQDEHMMTSRAVDLLNASSWSDDEAVWDLTGGVIIVNHTDPVQLLLRVDFAGAGALTVTFVATEWYWDDARTIAVAGGYTEWPRGEKTLHELIVEVMRASPSDTWTCPSASSFPIPTLADLRKTL